MIRVIPEGEALKNGFNFYPLSEYKTSIGFRFLYGKTEWKLFFCRYAPHVNKFYFGNK